MNLPSVATASASQGLASPGSARRIAAVLVAAKLALHLALLGRWDIHRDEYYFIVCARRLAAGYVDHPPMIAWLTALAGEPSGYHLMALRLVPAVLGAATMALTAALVRVLGGGAGATLLAGVCFFIGPVFLRTASLVCIPMLEPLLWGGAALQVLHLARGASPRRWLALGALVGVGLLTKHTMGLWALGLGIGVAATPLRAALRSRWPWLGLAVAVLLFLPNLLWQIDHDFATVEFLRAMSEHTLQKVPRSLFLLGVILYLSPITLPVWGVGLWTTLRRGAQDRAIGVAVLLTVAVLLVTHGKPYYVTGAFPVLFAIGACAIERWYAGRGRALRWPAAAALLLGGAPLFFVALPIVPLDDVDGALASTLGWATPPENLTGELHDQFGWREEVAAVRQVAAGLSDVDQSRAVVLTANYGQAASVEVLAQDVHLGPPRLEVVPPVVSGQMSYFLWGVPEGRGDVAIALGLSPEQLGRLYGDCREAARTVDAPQAWPRERGLPVLVCRAPLRPLREVWSTLKVYDHVGPLPMRD